MKLKIKNLMPKWSWILIFSLGVVAVFLGRAAMKATSTDEYCASCHVHPQATQSWKLSVHHDTGSGVVIHCVDCHLPPEGFYHLWEKGKAGIRDAYGMMFKDTENIDWEEKSRRQHAEKYVFKQSCNFCHQNLYPRGISKKGADAHLHYDQHADELRCLNCHIDVGHFQEKPVEVYTLTKAADRMIYTAPAEVTAFEDFTETVPGTPVDFEMVALPGGEFTMGSPPDESFRKEDEGPQRQIKLSPFWIGKAEVSWLEYDAFLKATGSEGRTEDQYAKMKQDGDVDGITGPTPAYGNPDQGWGRGERPAITMTWYAANVYCEWLSNVTGRKYRLPTEAEWEYAARGGTEGAYFFEGDPERFSDTGLLNKIFGPDTSVINSYVIYEANSGFKTHLPSAVRPNPKGLLHSLGNVREFCSDWYQPDAYGKTAASVVDPRGPAEGEEHVIRGGSYSSDAAGLRIADRDHTLHDTWMRTDPQIPKSLWWYSDNSDVGFRVVCEYDPVMATGAAK
jgi:formylglycine-generating enzyme required for sulfatase activity/nitrate/TMAO reductase-like tetraheme cytochrome c subunit